MIGETLHHNEEDSNPLLDDNDQGETLHHNEEDSNPLLDDHDQGETLHNEEDSNPLLDDHDQSDSEAAEMVCIYICNLNHYNSYLLCCYAGQCRCYLQYKKAGENGYSITVHKHEDISVEKPNSHVLKRDVENHSAAFLSMVGVQFCNVMVLHAEDQMHHV